MGSTVALRRGFRVIHGLACLVRRRSNRFLRGFLLICRHSLLRWLRPSLDRHRQPHGLLCAPTTSTKLCEIAKYVSKVHTLLSLISMEREYLLHLATIVLMERERHALDLLRLAMTMRLFSLAGISDRGLLQVFQHAINLQWRSSHSRAQRIKIVRCSLLPP